VLGVLSTVVWFFAEIWGAAHLPLPLDLALALSLEFGLLFLSGFVGCRVVFGRGPGFVGVLSGSAIAFAWMAICVSVIVVAMNFADSKGVFSGMCFCGFGL
jgi:hypothetical protein